MNKENNELMVNTNTGEILETNIKRETEDYKIIKRDDGKFEKVMKYHDFSTRQPETETEKIELFRVFNDEDNTDLVTPMKSLIGETFTITDFYIQAYESFDENTGNSDYGAITTLKTKEKNYITTSSKSVYYTIKNIYNVFGLPFKVKIIGTQRERGIQINLSLVGK